MGLDEISPEQWRTLGESYKNLAETVQFAIPLQNQLKKGLGPDVALKKQFEQLCVSMLKVKQALIEAGDQINSIADTIEYANKDVVGWIEY